jgi:hypothetical protein
MVQGSSLCLSVMVMITVRPSLRYSPLSISCEKRPDPSSPRRVAPFSLAVLLARSSSEVGLTLAPITTRNVLCILAHPNCYFAEISTGILLDYRRY